MTLDEHAVQSYGQNTSVPSKTEILNVVGVQRVPGRRVFDKVNPVDGSVNVQVHEADQSVVDQAVSAARASLTGSWASMPVTTRAELLRRIADVIDERFEDLVAAEIADTGKPEKLVRELDVPRAAHNFRAFADIISSAGLDSFLTDLSDGAQRSTMQFGSHLASWQSLSPGTCPSYS